MKCLGEYDSNNARCFGCTNNHLCLVLKDKSYRNLSWDEKYSINEDSDLRGFIVSQLPEAYRRKADRYTTLGLMKIRDVIYSNSTKLTIHEVALITLTVYGSAIHLRHSDFPPRDRGDCFRRKDVIEWMKQKKRYFDLAQSLDQIDYTMESETTAKEVKRKKTITITWESLEDGFTINLPDTPTNTKELVGLLEMCKTRVLLEFKEV